MKRTIAIISLAIAPQFSKAQKNQSQNSHRNSYHKPNQRVVPWERIRDAVQASEKITRQIKRFFPSKIAGKELANAANRIRPERRIDSVKRQRGNGKTCQQIEKQLAISME